MPLSSLRAAPLSVEQLEAGLLILEGGTVAASRFRDEALAPFRETVRLALRETSDALLMPGLPPEARALLNRQHRLLRLYAALADRRLAQRAGLGGLAQPSSVFPDRLQ